MQGSLFRCLQIRHRKVVNTSWFVRLFKYLWLLSAGWPEKYGRLRYIYCQLIYVNKLLIWYCPGQSTHGTGFPVSTKLELLGPSVGIGLELGVCQSRGSFAGPSFQVGEVLEFRLEKGAKSYPLLQIPTCFRVSCRPSTKKGGIYPEKTSVFFNNTP